MKVIINLKTNPAISPDMYIGKKKILVNWVDFATKNYHCYAFIVALWGITRNIAKKKFISRMASQR